MSDEMDVVYVCRNGENPELRYSLRTLGVKFHETNEHDAARARADLHEVFNAITQEDS